MRFDAARLKLESLEGKSRLEKMLGVTAVFTELTAKYEIYPVIVGGLAVEIYTRNEYTTVDIDLIFSRRDVAGELFLDLGFIKEGRHWYHENLGVSIEIPNDILDSADQDKVTKLNLSDGSYVYVVGIEDIILDRLRGCIHWTSPSDCEWGYRLFLLHRKNLDIDYMLGKAREDLTLQQLQSWMESLE